MSKCPRCESQRTRICWTKANAQFALVRSLQVLGGMVGGGSFDRYCRDCGHRFTPDL